MRYLLILMILISYPLLSIEVTNYKNDFAQVTGIYESKDHGLFIANSLGVFKLDKETKAAELVPYKDDDYSVSHELFFEYEDEIYCYRVQGYLYRIRDGKLEYVMNRVVAHLVRDDKLYLLRSKEPRIQVLNNSVFKDFYVGDYDGMHLFADLIEIKGDVYAYLGLNWSGNEFIVKITDNGLDYIMSPTHSNHDAFDDLLPSQIHNVADELWVQTAYGFYKFIGTDYEKVDDAYSFDDFYVYQFLYENDKIYGINQNGIFVTDIITKETEYLATYTLDYRNQMNLLRGKKYIYFLVGNDLYTYNPDTEEFTEFQKDNSGKVFTFIEGTDEKLFIVKGNLIEWYNDVQPTILGGTGVHTNEFFDIAYDKYENKLLALGLSGKDYLLQTYDWIKWDIIPIPFTNKNPDNVVVHDINVEVDFQGNYYVGIEEFFGLWDGSTWERLSFLTVPKDSVNRPREEYHVLCVDSLGGVWVSVSLREYSKSSEKYESKNSIIRITSDGVEIIEDNANSTPEGYFRDGICTNKGDVVINSWGDEIYYYSNGQGKLSVVDDGDYHPIVNSQRYLCQNRSGEAVICFNKVVGWSSSYGNYELPGGISIYDGNLWEHDYYKDIAEQNEIPMYGIRVLYDKYGNDFIISENKFIGIRSDAKIDVFTTDELSLEFDYQIVQLGNEIWITSRNNGLYKVLLPVINSVSDLSESEKILKNEVLSNGVLELLEDIKDYRIYTISGKLVGSGKNKSTIDVSYLSSGAYFIVCETYNKPFARKFLINR